VCPGIHYGWLMTEQASRTAGVSASVQARFANRDEMFGAVSRAFLATVPTRPDLALDLGCSLGYTTRMVAQALRCRRTVGMDLSAAFVEFARRGAPEGVEFLVHDVTRVPVPTGPADLVYARFVLPHVPEPLAVVMRWASQLRPGGHLLLDEVEAIRGDEDDASAFHRCLALADAVREHHGLPAGEVGASLAAMAWTGPVRCVRSSGVSVRPPAGVVVTPLLLNLRAWRRDPFVQRAYPEPAMQRLEAELRELAAAGGPAPITWDLRQVVLAQA
jgi:trans-aconitate 2-methyltransferase